MKNIRMSVYSGTIKKMAKEKLAGHWLEAASVALIYMIIGEVIPVAISQTSTMGIIDSIAYGDTFSIANYVGLVLFKFIWYLLLAGVSEVGFSYFSLELVRDGEGGIADFFHGFTKFWKALKQYVLFSVMAYLPLIVIGMVAGVVGALLSPRVDNWFMVFIIFMLIAGIAWIIYLIVLTLGCAFQFFLVADEHHTYRGAIANIKESMSSMNGNKGHIFGFYISFIGWYILASLPGAIYAAVAGLDSQLWVSLLNSIPLSFVYAYVYTSKAIYYRILTGEMKIESRDGDEETYYNRDALTSLDKDNQGKQVENIEVEVSDPKFSVEPTKESASEVLSSSEDEELQEKDETAE